MGASASDDGHKPLQVLTDVLGIKCAPKDAKLLGEFLTCMASATSNDQHDGITSSNMQHTSWACKLMLKF